MFDSVRIKSGTVAYENVKQLAAELTRMGCDIMSAGGPGLMQAANEGALLGDEVIARLHFPVPAIPVSVRVASKSA